MYASIVCAAVYMNSCERQRLLVCLAISQLFTPHNLLLLPKRGTSIFSLLSSPLLYLEDIHTPLHLKLVDF